MAIFRKRNKVDESQLRYQDMLVKFKEDYSRAGDEKKTVILNYNKGGLHYIINGKERITNSVNDVSKEMILRLMKELVSYKLCEKFEIRFNL